MDEKEKFHVSRELWRSGCQILHGSLPGESRVPGCKSGAAPGAQGRRESMLSYSWMLPAQGGRVPFPRHAKGTCLQEKGS